MGNVCGTKSSKSKAKKSTENLVINGNRPSNNLYDLKG